MGYPSRYDDFDRLEFLIDHPGLTVKLEKLTFRWVVYDPEARKAVSRRCESAREALDDAIQGQHFVHSGLLPP
jgi:hypothetical protein